MKCDACGIDKTVTVTTSIKLNRINLHSGRETTEVRTTRLCPACGGEQPDRDERPSADREVG